MVFAEMAWQKIAAAIALATGQPGDTAQKAPPDPVVVSAIHQTQIFFPKSSAYLRSTERAKIAELAEEMVKLPEETLLIRGMTDRWGNPNFNKWLREQRGQAVFDKLIENGVTEAQLGFAEPLDTPADRSIPSKELRRVEFTLAGIDIAQLEVPNKDATGSDKEEKPVVAAVRKRTITLSPTPLKPRFTSIGRRDRYRLNALSEAAGNTSVFFEHAGTQVKSEYRRDLGALANALLATSDGALSIRGFAAPSLSTDERGQLANSRCLSAAGMLQQLGVQWDRIRIEDETGEIPKDEAPSWRHHRVEFTAIQSVAPRAIATVEYTEGDLEAQILSQNDPLAALVADTIVQFSSNSASVRSGDRAKLREIAALATEAGEKRSVSVSALTDRWGNPEYNRRLGVRRQKAVLSVLTKAGLPEERAIAGAVSPADENEPGPSWRQRRAELALSTSGDMTSSAALPLGGAGGTTSSASLPLGGAGDPMEAEVGSGESADDAGGDSGKGAGDSKEPKAEGDSGDPLMKVEGASGDAEPAPRAEAVVIDDPNVVDPDPEFNDEAPPGSNVEEPVRKKDE